MSENLSSGVKNVRGSTELTTPYCFVIADAFLTPMSNKKPFGWRNTYAGVILIFFCSISVHLLLTYCICSDWKLHNKMYLCTYMSLCYKMLLSAATWCFLGVYGFHAGKTLKYTCLFVLFAVCSFSALENKLNAIRFFTQVGDWQLLKSLTCKTQK